MNKKQQQPCTTQDKHMQKYFVCALVMKRYKCELSAVGCWVLFFKRQTLEPKRQLCTFIVKVFRAKQTKQMSVRKRAFIGLLICFIAVFISLPFLPWLTMTKCDQTVFFFLSTNVMKISYHTYYCQFAYNLTNRNKVNCSNVKKKSASFQNSSRFYNSLMWKHVDDPRAIWLISTFFGASKAKSKARVVYSFQACLNSLG